MLFCTILFRWYKSCFCIEYFCILFCMLIGRKLLLILYIHIYNSDCYNEGIKSFFARAHDVPVAVVPIPVATEKLDDRTSVDLTVENEHQKWKAFPITDMKEIVQLERPVKDTRKGKEVSSFKSYHGNEIFYLFSYYAHYSSLVPIGKSHILCEGVE